MGHLKQISWTKFVAHSSINVLDTSVTWSEAKEEVKRPKGAPARCWAQNSKLNLKYLFTRSLHRGPRLLVGGPSGRLFALRAS